MPKVKNSTLRLREHDFDTGECEYCRYYQPPDECKVLVGPVDGEKVCDAFQGDKDFVRYKVNAEDVEAFTRGMQQSQPYQHKVIKSLDTPVGWLIIIQDTMRPKPHRFSLDLAFHMEHTAREHHWTQKEVDRLIRVGRSVMDAK